MSPTIYTDGQYLEQNASWHLEDSPWKADQIEKILRDNRINPELLAEVGCGAGGILESLSKRDFFSQCQFQGYDISPQANELSKQRQTSKVQFHHANIFEVCPKNLDVLLVIDVFEHVPDYMGFLTQCQKQATYKVYHIPLDVHVSSVVRNTFGKARDVLGHIHYFTADSALAALKDTNHEIIDYFYTQSALGLYQYHPQFKTAVANIPRWVLGKINLPLTARLFGGYSLLVLTK
jgi:hypothetical protein